MNAYILSIGAELLHGHITDTNATFLSQELDARGIELLHVIQVGDDRKRICESIERALSEADIVICTGGIGPTEDDLTREGIADALGETPEVDAELRAEVEAFFAKRGLTMPERNAKQAWLIPSAEALPNPVGTAPGWFVETDGKHYWLTPRVLRLGLSYLHSLPYWRHAQLALEELCARVRQSCALSVLDGEDIVYLLRQHTKRILPVSPSLGSRLPAHAVSMGRVLLAALPDDALDTYLAGATLKPLTGATVVDRDKLRRRILQARTQGFAWVDRELDESICGLAVPVRDADGRTVAAINVSLPTGEFDREQAARLFLLPLRQAASQLRSSMI